LLFNCWKCCANIFRRNTSQRPPKPPHDRSDRFRARKPSPIGSLRREKQALHPPMAGRGRGGGRRLGRVDAVGDQRHRRVHPRRWTRHSTSKIIRCMSRCMIRRIILRSLSLISISLMRISSISMRIIMSNLILSRSNLILRSLAAGWYWAATTAWWWGSFSGGAEGGVRGRTGRLCRGAFWAHAFTLLWWTCGMQDLGWCRCKYILMFTLFLLLFIQLILIIILLI